jgi:adenosine deaminase
MQELSCLLRVTTQSIMEDNWLGDNMILVRDKCGFTDRKMLQLQMSALEMFWAGEKDKRVFLDEFEKFKRDRC